MSEEKDKPAASADDLKRLTSVNVRRIALVVILGVSSILVDKVASFFGYTVAEDGTIVEKTKETKLKEIIPEKVQISPLEEANPRSGIVSPKNSTEYRIIHLESQVESLKSEVESLNTRVILLHAKPQMVEINSAPRKLPQKEASHLSQFELEVLNGKVRD